MSKNERGIFGIRKDPKNQMLFSFKVRKGAEWPSDDSGDSDYKPSGSDPEVEPVVAPKRRKPPKKKKRRRINVIESDSDESDDDSDEDLDLSPSADTDRLHNTSQATASSSNLLGNNNTSANQSTGVKPSANQNHLGTFDLFNEDVAKSSKYGSRVAGFGDRWGRHIPPEVLLKVFVFAVEAEGALPFLCRAARVCTLWSNTAADSRLWQRVDLSYGWIKSVDRTLQWLCQHRLSRLTELNLSSWKMLTNQGLQAVADNCQALETINLSHCGKVQSAGVKALVDNCPQLRNVDLSFMSAEAVSHVSLKNLIETRGENLESLNFSGNMLKNFNTLLNTIAEKCHNLQVLDVCNALFSTDFISLNIERLQHGCPRLKVLRLTNSKFRATYASGRTQAESRGFPNLQELSLAVSTAGLNVGIALNDEFLHRVLKTSHDLKLLDLRGCSHVTCRGLQMLSVTDLQHFYISQSSIAKHEGLDVVLHKWKHSLMELDLSWNTFQTDVLDSAIEALTSEPQNSHLGILNLSGTPVSSTNVRSILKGCPKLHHLNLGSCRGLPRGLKRDYDRKSLKKLKADINDMIDSSSDDTDDYDEDDW